MTLLRCRQLVYVDTMRLAILLLAVHGGLTSLLSTTVSTFSPTLQTCIDIDSHRQSSVTLADYAALMQNSIYRDQAGLTTDTDSYCEDVHLMAVSLLYNIDICVYSEDTEQWHVFNEAATCGYILLWNSRGHFDVLKGLVPPAAHTHAVSRQSFSASDEVWQILQRQYSFDFVAAFPEHFTYINVLNNPVVHVTIVIYDGKSKTPTAAGGRMFASETS